MTGATQQYVATGTYSDNSTAVITSSVIWSSGTPAVAAIAPTGLATGVSAA
ncbi:Ig-like domain-containing protein [Massilia sp. B-10]|nr:Ig-like domain-containing protein [Massilia sp. B-10]